MAVAKKAKKSFCDWARQARTWDYKGLCKIIPDNAIHNSMMELLLQMGFYIINQPHKCDVVSDPVGCILRSKSVKANQTSLYCPVSIHAVTILCVFV